LIIEKSYVFKNLLYFATFACSLPDSRVCRQADRSVVFF